MITEQPIEQKLTNKTKAKMYWVHIQTSQLRGLCTYFLFLTQIIPLHYERLISSVAVKEGRLDADGSLFDSELWRSHFSNFFFSSIHITGRWKEAGNEISYSIMDLKGVSWTWGSRYLFSTQRTMSPLKESKKIKNDSLKKQQYMLQKEHFRNHSCRCIHYYNTCTSCFSACNIQAP